jgi:ComF family protein
MFRALLQGLIRHLPSQCAICHSWPAQPLCAHCVDAFAQPVLRCRTCAVAIIEGSQQCTTCLSTPPVLDGALAAVDYAYPWSQIVQELKFHDHTGWVSSMATLMRSTPWVEPALEAAKVLIPMPLSRERLQERGFNQVQLLAHALCPEKIDNSVLQRQQHTAALSSMDRKKRLSSIKNAYAVNPACAHHVKGKKIVLLDDVMTTGASLQAAAKVLRAAGAAHITALVFARTP